MRPPEAKVYIIERDPELLEQMTVLVESTGGEVVGVANRPSHAYKDIHIGYFPKNAGNPNVLLIDGVSNRGSLDELEHDSTDVYFGDTYRYGHAHRADRLEGLGAVAIGYSPDEFSMVEVLTGANLGSLDNQEEVATRWVALLEPHPADPVYLDGPHEGPANFGPNEIVRTDWHHGYTFERIINSLTNPDPDAELFADPVEMDVKVHAMMLGEVHGGDETFWADIFSTPDYISLGNFIKAAKGFQSHEGEDVGMGDSRAVKAVIEANDHINVIDSVTRYISQNIQITNTRTDKIALKALAKLPDTYWQAVGIKPPATTD